MLHISSIDPRDLWLYYPDLLAVARLDVRGEQEVRVSFPTSATSRRASSAALAESTRYLRTTHQFPKVSYAVDSSVTPPPHLVFVPTSGPAGAIYFSSTSPTFAVGFTTREDFPEEVFPIAATVAQEHHADFLALRGDYLDLAARKIIQARLLPPELAQGDSLGHLVELWTATPDVISPLWPPPSPHPA